MNKLETRKNCIDPHRIYDYWIRIPLGIIQDTQLSWGAKMCWGLLASTTDTHQLVEDATGTYCSISQKELAEEMNMSPARIQQFVKELEDQGHIIKEYPTGSGVLQHKPVKYYFDMQHYYVPSHPDKQ